MNVSAPSSTTTTAAAIPADSGASAGLVDPDMFLKLLVSTIQNQDPTNPTDPSQMLQQLASMSQVQQSAQTNTKLASILETISIGQSATLIGRQITDDRGQSLGRIEAVRVTGDGLVARMVDGSERVLGNGLTVSS